MIFGMMILVIAASLFFIDIAVTGIVAGSITAMAFGWFMGWISLTWGMLISLIIIGGILISRAIR